MTLDNMTGITKGSYTGDTFCKSQLITCNRVKECNGVCPFEDALQHADKMQAMDEQHIINHDRDWIVGCIEHDGFIHTDRFDKANQIIHDALSADAVEVVRCKDCIHWFPHTQCGFDEDNDEYHDYCGLLIPEDDYYAYRRKADDYCSYGARMPGEDGEA